MACLVGRSEVAPAGQSQGDISTRAAPVSQKGKARKSRRSYVASFDSCSLDRISFVAYPRSYEVNVRHRGYQERENREF